MKYLMFGIMALSLLPLIGISDARPLCPGGFEGIEWVQYENPDENGNGIVCEKELPNGKIILRDDFHGLEYITYP
jgi:hypothetical protein